MSTATLPEAEELAGHSEPVVHTPGPWHFEDAPGLGDEVCFQTINDPAGHHVASTWAGPHLGNARLIASAPSLLAALRRAVETIRDWHGEDAWDLYQHSPEMKEINAAIQEATGLVV